MSDDNGERILLKQWMSAFQVRGGMCDHLQLKLTKMMLSSWIRFCSGYLWL